MYVRVRPSGVWAYSQNTCERKKGGEKECRVPIGPKGTSLHAGWRPKITAVESAEQHLGEGHFPERTSVSTINVATVESCSEIIEI